MDEHSREMAQVVETLAELSHRVGMQCHGLLVRPFISCCSIL